MTLSACGSRAGKQAPGESALTLTWTIHTAAASSSRAELVTRPHPTVWGQLVFPGTQFEEHLTSQDTQVFPVQGGCEESILRHKEEKALLFLVIEAEKKEKEEEGRGGGGGAGGEMGAGKRWRRGRRGGEGGGCWAAWLTEVLLCFRHLLSACRTGTVSSVPPRTLSKTHYYPHFATPITEA